jgi:hypothetical protein
VFPGAYTSQYAPTGLSVPAEGRRLRRVPTEGLSKILPKPVGTFVTSLLRAPKRDPAAPREIVSEPKVRSLAESTEACAYVQGELCSARPSSEEGEAVARRLTIMRLKGDPEELLQTKQQKLDPVAQPKAREYGGISQAVAKTSDGLLMVNLWESEEGSDAMRQDSELDQMLRESMMQVADGPPEVEHYELVDYNTP